MRHMKWILIAAVLLAVTGCVAWDALLGVKTETVEIIEKVEVTDPDTGETEIIERVIGTEERRVPTDGPSPLEMILGLVLPAAAGLGALGRWGYIEASNRKLAGTAKAIIAGVTEAVDKGVITSDAKPALYKILGEARELYANKKFFIELVAKTKAEIRAIKKK